VRHFDHAARYPRVIRLSEAASLACTAPTSTNSRPRTPQSQRKGIPSVGAMRLLVRLAERLAVGGTPNRFSLAERLGVSPSRAAGWIAGLRALGLVTTSGPLRLTPAGERMLEDCR
jgi:hypothetical protein